MEHVMVDLETYGKRPGCPILSIGAVFFDPRSGELGKEFYTVADKDQIMYALREDPETVDWWSKQSAEARRILDDPEVVRQPLGLSLLDFGAFLGQSYAARPGSKAPNEYIKVWGNGADFDNAILQVAYGNTTLPLPWQFWNNRCYRTIKALRPGIKIDRAGGTHHNALDDAKAQARHLLDIVQNDTFVLQ